MSREIKYRVWDNENKSYNDPYSHSYYAMTQDGGLDFYCHGDHWGSCDPDKYIIEQYTGSEDKNGEKLWNEIEDFLYDYDDGKNYCDTYIDVKYNTTAITAFLESKIEEIKNERAR